MAYEVVYLEQDSLRKPVKSGLVLVVASKFSIRGMSHSNLHGRFRQERHTPLVRPVPPPWSTTPRLWPYRVRLPSQASMRIRVSFVHTQCQVLPAGGPTQPPLDSRAQ